MTESKITSVEQVLSIAKKDQIKYASGYWAPSLQKDVRFTEITTSQQKRLIKSIVDSPIFNTEFIYTLYEIFTENCIEKEIKVDQLTILDKLLISIGLRATCIGSDLEIDITPSENEGGGKPFSYTIDLMKLYEKIKKSVKDVDTKTFDNKTFIVTCGIPTISTELKLEQELRGHTNKIDIDTNEELRDILGTAFIGEMVKYIRTVSAKIEGGKPQEIDWGSFSFEDRIKIAESFGMDILRDIIDYVGVIKKEVDKVELIKFKKDKEEYERRLTIDGRFFTVS